MFFLCLPRALSHVWQFGGCLPPPFSPNACGETRLPRAPTAERAHENRDAAAPADGSPNDRARAPRHGRATESCASPPLPRLCIRPRAPEGLLQMVPETPHGFICSLEINRNTHTENWDQTNPTTLVGSLACRFSNLRLRDSANTTM